MAPVKKCFLLFFSKIEESKGGGGVIERTNVERGGGIDNFKSLKRKDQRTFARHAGPQSAKIV